MKSKATILVMLMLVGWFGISRSVQAAGVEAPLKITPQNTIILGANEPAGRFLQYELIKAMVDEKTAEAYSPDDAKIDRSKAPFFPLIEDGESRNLPEGRNVLAVGKTRFLDSKEIDRLEKNPGAILLRRKGNVVVIAGSPFNEPWVGGFTAMSEFLQTVAGVRFYAPGTLWTSRPKDGVITVEELDLFRKAVFASSQLSPVGARSLPRNKEWFLMNQNADRMTIDAKHNLANIFPPEKYGKTHPEVYEMRDGKRIIPANQGRFKGWQPSLVAPKLPDLTMDYIRDQMKKNPKRKYISLGMMDVHFNDETPEAKASVEKHGDYSVLYWTYVNEVARRARKEFPQIYITGFCYGNASTVPKDMQFEPNVAVKYVSKSYRYQMPGYFESETRDMKEFADAGAKILIHDWNFGGVSPRSYSRSLARFLQWGATHGMIGTYFEWSDGENWYLDGPRYWMLMRLVSNPFEDVNLLLKTYCDDMFGPASEPMFQFFSHFEDKFAYAHETIHLFDLPKQEFAIETPDDLEFERRLLDRAQEKAGEDPKIRERLATIVRYWKAHEKFALAASQPVRLRADFKSRDGAGINKSLITYYVTDDGSKLKEALRYYDQERTVLPDRHSLVEDLLGMRSAYCAAYSGPLGEQLGLIRNNAIERATAKRKGRPSATEVNKAAEEILEENLPPNPPASRRSWMRSLVTRNVDVPSVDMEPVLDGSLDEEIWKSAAPLEGFTQIDTLGPETERTEGRIMRKGDKIYLAVTCRQEGNIWAVTTRDTVTGTYIWRESGIEVFFGPTQEPGGARPEYAQYVINSLGAFRGFGAAVDNREGVEVVARVDSATNRYFIEAALPLKAAKYDYVDLDHISFTLLRNTYRKDSYTAAETVAWHPLFTTGSAIESRGNLWFRNEGRRIPDAVALPSPKSTETASRDEGNAP